MARTISVEIVGDSRSLERAFQRSSKSASKFGRDMKQAGRSFGVGGAVGGGALLVGLEKSVSAASDLSEQMSKTGQVFGQSAGQVEAWSRTTTKAFGISERQALATASSFGALFAPLGLVGSTAASQSKRLTELGANLASFYNTDVQDALDAIRSGVVGESEPLRRYGVLLSETRVQREAMSETGKKNATQLTAQEKALARIAIILKDSAKAQGDFKRTSEGLANQTRILKANMDDLSVSLGQNVVPAAVGATNALNDMFAAMRPTSRGILDFLGKVKGPSLLDMFGVKSTAGPSLLEILAGRRGQAGPKPGIPGFQTRLGPGVASALDLLAPGYTKPPLARRPRTGFGYVAPRSTTFPTLPKGPSAAMRNEWFDATIGRQLDRLQDVSLRKQVAGLKTVAAEVRAQQAVTNDKTRRLTLEDQLLQILRQQRQVQSQIGDEIKAANQALKDRADAIKSAVLDRLQRRQTDVLNKRALQDAQEQLRTALQLGGPAGIRAARRSVQDVRYDMTVARLQNAPASLTRGGEFAYGGVVINIHGVTDPDAVARKVAAVLQRRQRHTTTQTRGPAAGTHAGQR